MGAKNPRCLAESSARYACCRGSGSQGSERGDRDVPASDGGVRTWGLEGTSGKPACGVGQDFSSVNGRWNHLGILKRGKFWPGGLGLGLRCLLF